MFNEILLSSFIGAHKTLTHLGLGFDPNALMFGLLMVHNYASKGESEIVSDCKKGLKTAGPEHRKLSFLS